MSNRRIQRKLEHIQLFSETYQPGYTGFEDVHFVHQALPELNWDEIETSWCFENVVCTAPLYINAITGGHSESERINRDLARVAAVTGIGLAVGSQHAAFDNPAAKNTYRVIRSENPDGLVLANVGAGLPWALALQAIEMIEAQGLQIHLNVAQELMMGEGDREFRNWLSNIEQIVVRSPVPVIVKETGCGLSRETVRKLKDVGVSYFDVGGFGGTDFLAIEASRGGLPEELFLNWGLPTAWTLLECVHECKDGKKIWASGGITSPLAWAKALALGADAAGVAGHFFRIYQEQGIEGLIRHVQEWIRQLRMICLLCGVKYPSELKTAGRVITGKTAEWLKQRIGGN